MIIGIYSTTHIGLLNTNANIAGANSNENNSTTVMPNAIPIIVATIIVAINLRCFILFSFIKLCLFGFELLLLYCFVFKIKTDIPAGKSF